MLGQPELDIRIQQIPNYYNRWFQAPEFQDKEIVECVFVKEILVGGRQTLYGRRGVVVGDQLYEEARNNKIINSIELKVEEEYDAAKEITQLPWLPGQQANYPLRLLVIEQQDAEQYKDPIGRQNILQSHVLIYVKSKSEAIRMRKQIQFCRALRNEHIVSKVLYEFKTQVDTAVANKLLQSMQLEYRKQSGMQSKNMLNSKSKTKDSRIQELLESNANKKLQQNLVKAWKGAFQRKSLLGSKAYEIRVARVWLPKSVLLKDPLLLAEAPGSQTISALLPVDETQQSIIYIPQQRLYVKVKADDSAKSLRLTVNYKQNSVCSREIPIVELLYGNNYGRFYQLALKGNRNYDFDYTKDPKLESYHALREMPYLIQFTAIKSLFDGAKNQNSASQDPFRVYRQTLLKDNICAIPTHYGQLFSLKPLSEPRMHVFQKLFSLPPTKVLTPKAVVAFNETLLREFEKEQCRSKNSSLLSQNIEKLFLSSQSQGSLTPVNILRMCERGLSRRVEVYIKLLGLDSTRFEHQFTHPYSWYVANMEKISFEDMRNLKEDLKMHRHKQNSQFTSILYAYLSLRTVHNVIYCSSLIPLTQRLLDLVIYERQIGTLTDSSSIDELVFKLLVLFAVKVLPYYRKQGKKLFLEDLARIRILAKKLLKQFNYRLNREMIGLENLIAPKILCAFSQEFPELTYRIWDILVYASSNNNTPSMIPTLTYTYLQYLESNGMTEYFPINNFITSAIHNINRINPNLHSSQHLLVDQAKAMELYTRRNLMVAPLAQQRYVRRFLMSEPDLKIQDQYSNPNLERTTHGIFTSKNSVPQSRGYAASFPLHSINYPLPEPNFKGTKISYFHILAKKLNIYHSLGMKAFKIVIQEYPDAESRSEITIVSNLNERQTFINHYLRLLDWKGFVLKVKTVQFSQGKGEITLVSDPIVFQGHFQRDVVYKLNVKLVEENTSQGAVRNQNESGIDIIFVLESERTVKNSTKPLKRYSEMVPISVADYDFEEKVNSSVKAMKELAQHFEKIKHPLDEYGQPYSALNISGLGVNEYPWLKCNKKLKQYVFILII